MIIKIRKYTSLSCWNKLEISLLQKCG